MRNIFKLFYINGKAFPPPKSFTYYVGLPPDFFLSPITIQDIIIAILVCFKAVCFESHWGDPGC